MLDGSGERPPYSRSDGYRRPLAKVAGSRLLSDSPSRSVVSTATCPGTADHPLVAPAPPVDLIPPRVKRAAWCSGASSR